MNNYDKIRKILETGTCLVQVKCNDIYSIFSLIDSDGRIKRSTRCNNTEGCYDDGACPVDKNSIIAWNIKEIKAIPISHKEIKGNVDIVDCEDIREIKGWNRISVGMIGKTNLEIRSYRDNSNGQYYEIYNKDKSNWWFFPARFVIPTGCQTPNNDIRLSDKELLAEIERRGLLECKKLIK